MPENDLSLLIDAAKASGDIALKFFNQDPESWEKSNNAGPVTEADLAVDAYLKSTLLKARPDYGWLSEETEDTADRLACSRVFVVDPIDGTRAFIAGRESWAHSLAVVEHGQPIAAAVYLPARKMLFHAYLGSGAFLNGQQLAPPDPKDPKAIRILAAKPTFQPKNWVNDTPPEFEMHFRNSLAYRMALAAEGAFDAMMTLRKTWEWDIAAGVLLAREAGLNVTTRTGGSLVFNNANPMVDGVVAALPKLHTQIIEQLAPA
ncbi:3'(2'),5'-bisphosphate nucleotidase CysQ [Algirhabdus cladophorae]|uniref:3'(2'),5'-bisphosphate nucleotidase CysQ n=1 Tax=Algirhabdus cladophorae TaxID=3377108 RepID=UPI003B849D7C